MKDILLVVIAVLAVTANVCTAIPTKGAESLSKTKNCPATGFKRISHDTNCGLYYECVDGVKVEKVCEDGLSFDEDKGVCSWPPSNECSLNLKQAKPKSLKPKENCSYPSDCPSFGHSRYSYERDCRFYYECSNGRKCIMSCFEGYVFNPVLGTCDYPKNVPGCHPYPRTDRL